MCADNVHLATDWNIQNRVIPFVQRTGRPPIASDPWPWQPFGSFLLSVWRVRQPLLSVHCKRAGYPNSGRRALYMCGDSI